MGDDYHYDAAETSHRALRGIRRELNRHPLVKTAHGEPSNLHTHLIAELEPHQLDDGVAQATLTVRWFAGTTPDSKPEFSFHYSDDSDVDFGWHHEPNPHVDAWGHFQYREGSHTEYSYDPYSFSSFTPTQVVWEVMTALSSRLDE